jgi:hypothetical protein
LRIDRTPAAIFIVMLKPSSGLKTCQGRFPRKAWKPSAFRLSDALRPELFRLLITCHEGREVRSSQTKPKEN